MKLLKFIISIISLVAIFFIRWQVLFPSQQKWSDMPSSNWSAVPFYYPNFYYPSSCCNVVGQGFPAGWSISSFFILLVLWVLINLISFFIIKKFR